jgi:hypothetical protein
MSHADKILASGSYSQSRGGTHNSIHHKLHSIQSVQFNLIQFDSTQYNTISSIQYLSVLFNTISSIQFTSVHSTSLFNKIINFLVNNIEMQVVEAVVEVVEDTAMTCSLCTAVVEVAEEEDQEGLECAQPFGKTEGTDFC